MKRNEIKNSQRGTLKLVTDTPNESKDALSPFGPVRAGLTSSRTTQHQQLSELLSCLEKEVEILQFKYLEVCDTLLNDIVAVRAKLLAGIIDITGTNKVE